MKLENYTREILNLKEDIACNFWKIGNRLNEIKENKIYLEKYKFFERYIEEEVNFSHASANRYMQLARIITREDSTQLSLRKWDMVLPLKEEKREQVIKTVEKIKDKTGNVSDDQFKAIVTSVKEVSDEDYKELWDLESLGKRIVSSLDALKPSLKDFKYLYEKESRSKAWKKYPRRVKIIELNQIIIREVENLK